MNAEFETMDLPPIDSNNNRETELAKIESYRKSHPELLAIARSYDAPEARRTLSDIEAMEDAGTRQSLLKSLLLGLAGDPGSCDRLANAYMALILGNVRDHRQVEFWVERMYSIIGREEVS